MKTLIEVKTGKVVDTGDLITVNGKQVKLTDLDVPSLIAKGILTFGNCSIGNSKDSKDLSKKDTNSSSQNQIVIDGITIKNPLLQSILYNWGADQGMHSKEEIHNLISLIWTVYPQGLLSIALKEMSLEMHPDSTKIPPIVYVFNLTCGKMCPVNSESIACYDYIAYFTTGPKAEYAYSICKELIDVLF